MRIKLKKQNNRFIFDITDDNTNIVYASNKHHFLTPFVSSHYKYAWQACRDAWKLAHKTPYHIQRIAEDVENIDDETQEYLTNVSAEQMIVNHYVGILNDLRVQAEGMEDSMTEEKKKLYQQVKMIILEMGKIKEKLTKPEDKKNLDITTSQFQKIIKQYLMTEYDADQKEKPISGSSAQMLSTASSKSGFNLLDFDTIHELVEDYAQKICEAIQYKHNDVYYSISENHDEIAILDFNNKPILKIRINDSLIVDNIIPVGELASICPLHSVKFYQAYWKPIVEALKVVSVGSPAVLLKVDNNTLPDVPNSNTEQNIDGYNIENDEFKNINISFRGEKPIWMIEVADKKDLGIKKASNNPSKYTELQYLNAIVKCVDNRLDSIYGRTGAVIQVIPHDDIKMIEIDVDFGKGLGTVRLTEPQIQIVDLSNLSSSVAGV